MDAEQQLAEARKAWGDKLRAQSELSRMRRYTRLTTGMKDDQQRHSSALTQADATLARLLGGAS